MKILNQLLWSGKNKWQIAGAAIGAFIGLFLLLSALQFYFDLQKLIKGDPSAEQFILINKKVNLFNTLGARSTFTEEEIANLESQDFIQDVGVFVSNQFKVSASSQMLGFYTELFFESLPDEYIDISNSRWNWSQGDAEIPIILSRDYLALYNFGFAPSQGLPQFTPNTIGKLAMSINVSGNGLQKTFQGRIIGFSDRINSILVPLSFMTWANENFGDTQKPLSSRLILKTNNPYSNQLSEYLEKNNYEVSSGRLIGGQLSTLLHSIISIVAAIGVIIFLLSVLIFMLNFQLIISQSKEDIRLLLQLGYKTRQISNVLIRHLAYLYAVVFVLTVAGLFLSRIAFVKWFANQGFSIQSGLHFGVYAAIVLFSIAFVVLNVQNIRKNVSRLF